MLNGVVFLDDLDVERQVPLFSTYEYEYDKHAFLLDVIAEAGRKAKARQIVGPDSITSRVLDNNTSLDVSVDVHTLTTTIDYRSNWLLPSVNRTAVFDLDSEMIIPELISFIDTFRNVEIVQIA